MQYYTLYYASLFALLGTPYIHIYIYIYDLICVYTVICNKISYVILFYFSPAFQNIYGCLAYTDVWVTASLLRTQGLFSVLIFPLIYKLKREPSDRPRLRSPTLLYFVPPNPREFYGSHYIWQILFMHIWFNSMNKINVLHDSQSIPFPT